MGSKIEMSGKKFGRLRVVCENGKDSTGDIKWTCWCDCGNIVVVKGSSLRSFHTKSCGCLSEDRKVKHNHSKTKYKKATKTYSAWVSIKGRCLNKNNKNYNDYGGRGIIICDRWLNSFENFLADMGEAPKEMSIDRINNDKGYNQDNCKWSTQYEQNRNRRNSILDWETVNNIRNDFLTGNFIHKEIAKKYNISREHAGKIIRNKSWAV